MSTSDCLVSVDLVTIIDGVGACCLAVAMYSQIRPVSVWRIVGDDLRYSTVLGEREI